MIITLNRKSKNSGKGITPLRVRVLATGVAMTAICMTGFTSSYIPGLQPLRVEASELQSEASETSNVIVQGGNVQVVPPLIQESVAESISGGINGAINVVSGGDSGIQNVEDPEIKVQREAEEKARQDEELLAKYSFALYDTGGKRNDITPDILRIVEETCAQQGVDPNLMLSLFMTESEGHANAKNRSSTATGLGQMLRGTGRYVYEDLMGNGSGTYNHSMAYDPGLNVRMCITYMGQLKREKGSMYKAVQAYRGKKDISGYTAVMNKHLSKSGMSVSQFL